MAESNCNVINNVTSNQLSVVPRINQQESRDKVSKASLMDPMLLEDYSYNKKLPQSVVNVLEYLKNSQSGASNSDLLAGFVYIIMLECGFVDRESSEHAEDSDFNYKRLLESTVRFPSNWKHKDGYRFNLVLKSAPNRNCSIVCMTASDYFVVNCIIKNIGSYSTLIDPLLYFINSSVDLTKPKFQNLNHLSMTVKNDIAFPAKCSIVHSTGGICACLQDLPVELMLTIISYFSNAKDRCALTDVTLGPFWKRNSQTSLKLR